MSLVERRGRREGVPSQAALAPCSVCGGDVVEACSSPERMFGMGGSWRYSECSACGMLRLENPPSSLDAFYPRTYYSLRPPEEPRLGPSGRVLRRVRTEAALHGLRSRFDWAAWLRGAASTRSRILDFGSGAGTLVVELRKQGFQRVVGYDPYAASDEHVSNALPDGVFDVVMLHHVLEHLGDPADTLERVHKLLAPRGLAIVRVPLADSFSWRRYREDWVALDPPRHLFVFTETAIAILAGNASFAVESSWRDSSAFQFWASEQYSAGVPLSDPRSRWGGGDLYAEQVDGFALTARNLNRLARGDTGVFRLRPA